MKNLWITEGRNGVMRRNEEVLCYCTILATLYTQCSQNRKLQGFFSFSVLCESTLGFFFFWNLKIYFKQYFFQYFFRAGKRQISFFNISVQTPTIISGSCFEVVYIIVVAFNFEARKWSNMNADNSNKFHICILFIFCEKNYISIRPFYLLKGKQYLET